VVNVTRIVLESLAFIIYLSIFKTVSRFVFSFCEEMAGSMCVVDTAVLLAEFALV
jgi:hypothetical protein